jgi:hypothetical protein
MGYHITPITKGKVGELSKVLEEVNEALDAEQQNCDVIVLLELSDVIGAIESYLELHHPTITIESLITMKNITKKVFKEGTR